MQQGTHSKATGVAQRLGGAALMNDSGETGDERRLHSWGPEHISSCEMRDVVSDLQAEDTSTKAGHRQ